MSRIIGKRLVELACKVEEAKLDKRSIAFRDDMVERMGISQGTYSLSDPQRRYLRSIIGKDFLAQQELAAIEARAVEEHKLAREYCKQRHPEWCCCPVCKELRAEEAK